MRNWIAGLGCASDDRGRVFDTDMLHTLWQELDAAFGMSYPSRNADSGLPEAPQPGVASGRPRPLQSRREPQGRPGAVRVSCDLHDEALINAKAQHLPLGQALSEYAGAANKEAPLPAPARSARRRDCPWLKAMVDAGEIFHPLRWTPAEAFQLLTDVPRLEAQASSCACRPPGGQIGRRVRKSPPRSGASALSPRPDALLDFRMEVTLDGESLTAAEIERLLAQSDGLHWFAAAGSRLTGRDSSPMLDTSASRHAAAEGGLFRKRCAWSPARMCAG